jgi:uncharacterized protein (TIRG00374 family)
MQIAPGKKITTKKILQYAIVLLIAVVLLYFCFKGVKWSDFADGLRHCDYWWIAISMLFGISGFILRSWRWKLLTNQLNPSVTLKETYDGVTIGNLANFALPRVGELVRCGIVARRKKVTFEEAIGTVILERSWDLICLFLFAVLMVIFSWKRFGSFIQFQMINPAEGRLTRVLIIIVAAVIFLIAAAAVLIYIYRDRLRKHKFHNKFVSFLKGLWQGILAAFKMKRKWLFFTLTLLLWASFWATSYTSILAFPSMSEFTIADALFLMIVGSLGWAVPVQGGIGAYHFLVSLALAQIYGIAHAEGMVFATISHESQAFIMVLCGVISLISIAIEKKRAKTPDSL